MGGEGVGYIWLFENQTRFSLFVLIIYLWQVKYLWLPSQIVPCMKMWMNDSVEVTILMFHDPILKLFKN